MTKTSGVLEETPITEIFDITVESDNKTMKVILKEDKYILVHFTNPKTFNCRWKLLHKGENTLKCTDLTEKTYVELHRENDLKNGFVPDLKRIPPIPPPPGKIL